MAPEPHAKRSRQRVRAAAWWRAHPGHGIRALLALAFACALASGCGSRARVAEGDPAARAQQLIESGNAAYSQGDYRLAVRRYSAAAVVRKDDPAAYYGMGMALGKLGRDEEARAAYQRARDLSQAGGAPGTAPGAHTGGHP